MMTGLGLMVLYVAAQAGAAPAGTIAPIELPRVTGSLPCIGPDAEIVVCGRRPGLERYRIPPELREEPLISRNYSWSGRARDEREADRYGSLTVGPGGAFDRSRQVDCEWRAERQQIAGLAPDCSERVRAGPGQ